MDIKDKILYFCRGCVMPLVPRYGFYSEMAARDHGGIIYTRFDGSYVLATMVCETHYIPEEYKWPDVICIGPVCTPVTRFGNTLQRNFALRYDEVK